MLEIIKTPDLSLFHSFFGEIEPWVTFSKKIWGAPIAEIVSVASQIPKCHILGSFPKNVG